jgi:peptide/nickel transport system permease protein
VVAVLGSGLLQIVAVLVIAGWPGYARVVRAEVLSLREREFAAAARAVGASDVRILAQHVLPNVLPTVLVLATLHLPVVIVLEAALSFLGLGIQPPTPSLGQMVGYSQGLVWQAWWMPTIPGLAITVVVLAFNLLGDRLRDVLDPRLRGLGPA